MFGAIISLAMVAWSGGSGQSGVARQRVDLIELHHSYDEVGRHVFDQLVFYDWSEEHAQYRVIAWRMVKRDSQLPVRNWRTHEYRCVWQDDGVLRDVRAPLYRETWSQHDPERANRRLFPEASRPDLLPPPAAR